MSGVKTVASASADSTCVHEELLCALYVFGVTVLNDTVGPFCAVSVPPLNVDPTLCPAMQKHCTLLSVC